LLQGHFRALTPPPSRSRTLYPIAGSVRSDRCHPVSERSTPSSRGVASLIPTTVSAIPSACIRSLVAGTPNSRCLQGHFRLVASPPAIGGGILRLTHPHVRNFGSPPKRLIGDERHNMNTEHPPSDGIGPRRNIRERLDRNANIPARVQLPPTETEATKTTCVDSPASGGASLYVS